MNTAKHLNTGFTLAEVIVAVTILAGILLLASPLLISLFRNPDKYLISMDSIDQARIISFAFTNELRNATTGNDGSFPLNEAGNSEIVFYSNFGNSSGAVNRIRYYLLGNVLYKGIITPTGNPLTYNLASEVVKPIFSGLENGVTPAFYYYDGDYDGDTAQLSQPVNVNQVKFIKINLIVPKQTTPENIATFSINAGATIRSLKDNLGN